jgi:ElaB/YqjD/DUF883 family membrane-anchored ribosome-binding protein
MRNANLGTLGSPQHTRGNSMNLQNTFTPKSNLVDRVANSADHAVQATRQTTNHALDSVATRIDSLREQAAPALDRAAEQANALAARSREVLSNGTQHLRHRAIEATDNTAMYIRGEPFKAVAIAAAAGAVLALLVGLFGRSNAPR